ncbi:MAG: hypothetical protein ABSF79_09055 [Smithellaceae bacterium]|jgi:hypothetical protein
MQHTDKNTSITQKHKLFWLEISQHINRKAYIFVFLFVFSFSMLFAFYTQHAWEDWYITYRISKNLATGNGLVYTIGQKVQAFTSPIGTLIPALLNIITFNSSDDLVLWLFRFINCIVLGLTSISLLKIAHFSKFYFGTTLLLIGLFAVDTKIVDFSINGMETAYMVFFLISFCYLLIVENHSLTFLLGLVWAGLMYTRPDSCVYILCLIIGILIFNPKHKYIKNRLHWIKTFIFSGLICAVLYLPWFFWTWHYFGSPIPHTIVAKGLLMSYDPIAILKFLIKFPYTMFIGVTSIDATFMPPYYCNGWGNIHIIGKIITLFTALYWLVPSKKFRIARVLSFTVLLIHSYLMYVTFGSFGWIAPWYLPSVAILSIFVLAFGVQQLSEFTLSKSTNYKLLGLGDIALSSIVTNRFRSCLQFFIIAILSFTLTITILSAYSLKIQQNIIEN